jgi:putative ABC transport system permease protein
MNRSARLWWRQVVSGNELHQRVPGTHIKLPADTSLAKLNGSQAAYYAQYRMADIWAPVERLPRSVLRDLESVPGTRRVEGRILFEVTLDLPEMPQPVSARIVSVPDRRRRTINDLHLTRGRWFDREGYREVILAERFALEHNLDVGDRILAVMNNRKEALRIVALAMSPEFIYMIRGTGEILPDPTHFTVMWLSESYAESAFNFADACNEVVVTLDPDADPTEVIDILDDRLDRYGAIGAYERKNQLSHAYLQSEIDGLEGSATMVPAIFLGIAAFVLHTMMSRLIHTQRGQVAIFRAFGYTRADLRGHFLKLALAIGGVGAALGSVLGLWMGSGMGAMYREFYSLPILVFDPDPVALGIAWLLSLGFAALGAIGALRTISRVEPAEGMRPAAPAVYHRTLFERWPWLWQKLTFSTRMAFRQVARNKVRAAVTAFGVSLACSIVFLSFYSQDAVDVLIETQFGIIERQDIKVAFHKETGRSALYDLRRLPGVSTAEPELAVPVRLRNDQYEKQTGLTGMAADQTLMGLVDADLNPVPMPVFGLLLSRKLADILNVGVGDEVEVSVLNGKKPVFRVPVENIVDEYLGAFAYAEIGALSRWIGEEYSMTGARLAVDPIEGASLGLDLKRVPAIAAVVDKNHTLKMFRATLAESQAIMNTVLIGFAGIIMLGVIYNTARISLSERARELASMRVLGYTRSEVGAILAIENVLLVIVAIPFGLALGAFFAWAMAHAYETELFRFPFVVRPASLFWTVVLAAVFTLLANLAVQRRVRGLDLIEVLKERD